MYCALPKRYAPNGGLGHDLPSDRTVTVLSRTKEAAARPDARPERNGMAEGAFAATKIPIAEFQAARHLTMIEVRG
jgi:hypothetical protein